MIITFKSNYEDWNWLRNTLFGYFNEKDSYEYANRELLNNFGVSTNIGPCDPPIIRRFHIEDMNIFIVSKMERI